MIDLRQKIIDTAKGERHRHYDYTVKMAKLYKQIMTGDDQAELIVSYKLRETPEQKKQRIHITNSRTQYVGNKVMSVFDEIKRVDDIVDEIKWKEKDDERLMKIHDRMSSFYNQQPLKKYLYESIQHFMFYDPNAFIVVEMRKDEQEDVFTYPLEVTSEEAVNYEYKFGNLEYLVARHEITIKQEADVNGKFKGDKNKGSRYLLYAPDVSIDLKQIGKYDDIPDGYEQIMITVDTHKLTFAIKEYDTKSKVNPAIQVGYIRDPETKRETFVSPLHPAMKIIMDLINTKSEYDLSKALHGFIQKYAYAMDCDFNREEAGRRVSCHQGTLNTGGECPNCKGTGLILHKTVQDVVLIKAPDGREEHIPLEQMVHYVEIPDYIIEGQKNDIKDLERDVSLAIFNANAFDRSEVAVTATEKRLDLRSVYNVLSDYGDQYAEIYKHCVHLTAIHLMMDDEGFQVNFQFPSDFGLETISELIAQRKMASEASLPNHIIQCIDIKIMSKQCQDSPEEVAWQKSIEIHRPFRDKNSDELMFVLSSLPESDTLKRLYYNYEEVIAHIRFANPDFYKYPYDQQRKLVLETLDSVAPYEEPTIQTLREVVE